MSNARNLVRDFVFNILHVFVLGKTGSVEAKTGDTTPFTRWEHLRFAVSRRAVTTLNVWLLKTSRGRLGNSFLGMPVALLTTIGGKSGKPRTRPVYFMLDGERCLLVASNGGSPEDPAWLKNVRVHPRVVFERLGRPRTMICRVASAEEKARYWPQLTTLFPMWQEVQDRSGRDFPVAILEPAPDACDNPGQRLPT